MHAAKLIAIEEEEKKTNKRRHEKGKMNKGRMMRRREDRQKRLNGRQKEGWGQRYEREPHTAKTLLYLLSFLYKKFTLS